MEQAGIQKSPKKGKKRNTVSAGCHSSVNRVQNAAAERPAGPSTFEHTLEHSPLSALPMTSFFCSALHSFFMNRCFVPVQPIVLLVESSASSLSSV